MKLKPGVSLKGVKPEILNIIPVIDSCYAALAIEPTATCTTKDHLEDDPHTHGYAIDLRTHGIPVGIQRSLAAIISHRLGSTYYVTSEVPGKPNEHIHIQVRKDLWRKLEASNVLPI